MPRITIQSGEDAGKMYRFDMEVLTIGRSINNDLQIVDRRMSRNHSRITRKEENYFLTDLGSKNGTFLNGAVVEGEMPLQPGDLVQVGDTQFQVDLTDEQNETDNTSSPEMTVVSSSKVGKEGDSQLKVINEDNWGNTQGEIKAGMLTASPASTDKLPIQGKADVRHLEILYEIIEATRSTFSLEDLLNQIMDMITKVNTPDRAYLLIKEDGRNELVPEVIRDQQITKSDEIRISQSIVNRCMSEKVSLLVSDATHDDRFNASESVIMNRIRSAMVAPLIYKDETLGVVYLDTNTRAFPYGKEDLELMTGIANQAAVAIVNARLHSQLVEQHKVAREMEIARTIQMNLLPKIYPTIEGYEISAMSLPAKHVGGDYYDFLELPDGRHGLAIADVSGKGVPAAILTATTRSYLKSETQQRNITIEETVQRINRMVHRDVTNDMYVTMALLYLEPETGELEYVNAGHSHPVIMNSEGDTKFLDEGGLFLGIIEEGTYESAKAILNLGDVLVMETDGVTDIQDENGDPFGTEKLHKLIQENLHLSAEDLRNIIYNKCVEHRGKADQFDDFTMIVVKRIHPQNNVDSSDSMFEEIDLD